MNRIYSILILLCMLWAVAPVTPLAAKNKRKKTEESKTLTAYEKLFKDKSVTTARGLFRLHLLDDKIYLEIPSGLLGKPLLMGTTVVKVSDPQESSVGFQPKPPVRIVFERKDSLLTIRKMMALAHAVKSPAIAGALQNSQTGALLEAFPVKAYAPDSAVVIDATAFLFRDDPALNPIDPKGYNHMDGWVKRTATFKKANSMITGVEAYEDNASVVCCMSYTLRLSLFGAFPILDNKPFSAFVKRTFLLLPEKTDYMPRYADARVGTTWTSFTAYSEEQQGSRRQYYANRRAISPGHPAIFYMDTLLPPDWQESIKAGFAEWNKAFARIGMENALEVRPYPRNDSSFDANNIKYSCIRYVVSPASAITDHLWTNPATGEILNSNIFIPHNLAVLIQRNCFLQTANYNEKARTLLPDPEVVKTALTTMLMRHIGHGLGLEDNMAGSVAFPVDSLRSASFIRSHGMSASVMDELPFNYLLSSDVYDGNLPFTQQTLGEYDYWTIRWLYQPIPEVSEPEQELPVLRQWATQSNQAPFLFFSRPQNKKAYYDPRGMASDLGDDAIRAADYGFRHLAEVIAGADNWLEQQDKDYSQRMELYGHIINQADEYMKHVLQQVGGIYLNNCYAGEPTVTYQSVPQAIQRKSLLWAMREIEEMGWIDEPALLNHCGLTGSAADFAQKFFSNLILIQLNAMSLSESKSVEPYTQEEACRDIQDFLLQEVRSGKTPSEVKRHLLGAFTDYLISASDVSPAKSVASKETGKASLSFRGRQMGMTVPENISYESKPERAHFWYGQLLGLRETLNRACSNAPSRDLKDEYAYRIFLIDKALKGK